MESTASDMPCKIRKRRFPTVSSQSFPNNSFSQFLAEKAGSPTRSEKCGGKVDRSNCDGVELVSLALPEVVNGNGVSEGFERSVMSVERSRNKSRSSPGRGSAPEVINPPYRNSSSFIEKDDNFVGMSSTYVKKPFEEKSPPCGEIETATKVHGHSTLKPTHGLDEIKHSLTVSKELLKLLAHVCTTGPNHDHHHSTTMSLASTLNHELNKARYHVNKLIQEHRTDRSSAQDSKDQDKIRVAVKTISRELETERKLRRQSERMNKKLGRELASTKSLLANAVKKAESEKQATEVLEQLCEKMAHNIEEDRVELEELRRESERVREEMEEEREMLRVADILREERVQMKLIDAKLEYEDKHKQVDILVQDLEQLLERDNGIKHGIKHIYPRILSWYESNSHNEKQETTLWSENEVVNDEKALGLEGARGLSWFDKIGEVVNDEMTSTQLEIARRNSDCIEWEFGLDLKLNKCLDEKVVGLGSMKEYEDEMERYKMIKDLRDRIVSGGSELSRDTIEFGSYT